MTTHSSKRTAVGEALAPAVLVVRTRLGEVLNAQLHESACPISDAGLKALCRQVGISPVPETLRGRLLALEIFAARALTLFAELESEGLRGQTEHHFKRWCDAIRRADVQRAHTAAINCRLWQGGD